MTEVDITTNNNNTSTNDDVNNNNNDNNVEDSNNSVNSKKQDSSNNVNVTTGEIEQQQQQQQHPVEQTHNNILTSQQALQLEMNEVSNEMNKAIPQLTEGILLMTKIPLDALTMKLLELQKEQTALLSLMSSENQKLQSVKGVDIIFENKINEYLLKVQTMKKEMSNVKERMTKLQKRAVNLKEKKQQHINNLNERVEKALQRERDLTVKPSPQLVQQQQQQQLQPQKSKESLNTNFDKQTWLDFEVSTLNNNVI
ncbi:hypothetical protein PPL_06759 [Heterostelium album PN500]|uniref:Biogenesis of lysosome-related organelles complex 1 subunit 6 n=1 Tax=Heterostelium pallidum (strain ATCC 26659 / Pp 5 / PN500) TaxID=670386 RepID=D3BFM4_HETP5|nr:hypothetical protein PPL_06759 [Heterostelium album PN500]EFA79938.1 hypothetical protein PPL_06759 [Heterostelium album PN500]|eukprot:XP_020432058.1 hypothetical protein PPL_06759 [Heterostelium album PN500]